VDDEQQSQGYDAFAGHDEDDPSTPSEVPYSQGGDGISSLTPAQRAEVLRGTSLDDYVKANPQAQSLLGGRIDARARELVTRWQGQEATRQVNTTVSSLAEQAAAALDAQDGPQGVDILRRLSKAGEDLRRQTQEAEGASQWAEVEAHFATLSPEAQAILSAKDYRHLSRADAATAYWRDAAVAVAAAPVQKQPPQGVQNGGRRPAADTGFGQQSTPGPSNDPSTWTPEQWRALPIREFSKNMHRYVQAGTRGIELTRRGTTRATRGGN